MTKNYPVRVTLGFAILFILSCVTVRKYTYPPDFTYIEKKEISSSMWKLAVMMATVNHSMNDPNISPQDRQMEIVTQLKEMEKVGRTLNVSGGTNHPMIDQNIGQFVAELENARKSAEQTPPNFYLAGRLTGSCTSCHGLRP